MELVEVEITGQAITARYGTLSAGQILRTDAAFAKHLVEDAHAAKYKQQAKPAAVVAKPTAVVAKPTSPKKQGKGTTAVVTDATASADVVAGPAADASDDAARTDVVDAADATKTVDSEVVQDPK